MRDTAEEKQSYTLNRDAVADRDDGMGKLMGKDRRKEQYRYHRRQGPTSEDGPSGMKVAELAPKQDGNQQENQYPTEVNLNGNPENFSNPDGRSHRL